MLRPRIIPSLLVHGGGLVKTVRFTEPKYVGDPINAVKIFSEKEVDELIVMDIDASVERREPDFRLIGQLAAECRMPLCYGGGIKTVEHAKRIIRLGVEKIAISSAAMQQPKLISAIADEIGSQSVVVVLDVKASARSGDHEVWIHNGKTNTGRYAEAVAREAASLGAGEIVVNSIDHDGVRNGYDLSLARKIRAAIRLPMTMLGGAGSLSHLAQLISVCGVVGASAGSLFVFKGSYRAVLISYPSEAVREELIHAALNLAR